jgi:hypothetical protein
MAASHQRQTLRLITKADCPSGDYANELRKAAEQDGLPHSLICQLDEYAKTASLAEEAKRAAKEQAKDAKELWTIVLNVAKSGPDMADEGGVA